MPVLKNSNPTLYLISVLHFSCIAKYNIELELKPSWLSVKASGVIEGIRDVIKYSGTPITKALENGYSKVLVDERNVNIFLTDHDQHELFT